MEHLDRKGVKYVSIMHPPVFATQEVAQTTNIPGDEMAKTVLIKVDGKPAVAVLPASYLIDFDMQGNAIGASVALVMETEFRDLF
ncbi:MAG: YbaK/EbsC family protein [Bacteroidota bacterium]|nr:YbaK/EbsC family protein [Bacteroidota bacterium]